MDQGKVNLKMESWKIWEILGRIDRTWQPTGFERQRKGRVKDVYKVWLYARKRYYTRNMNIGRKAIVRNKIISVRHTVLYDGGSSDWKCQEGSLKHRT